MTLLRRPVLRFFLWAVFLVAVAAGAGVAGLSSWFIGGLVFGAWVMVALCERQLSGHWSTGRTGAAHLARPVNGNDAVLEPELSSVVRVTPAIPLDEPAAVAPTPAPAPAPAQRRRVVPRRSQPAPPPSETQWNVWTLEEVVRENAPENDELVYLTVSLRDFADANGLLPAGFDPLVRESFGSLLPLAG